MARKRKKKKNKLWFKTFVVNTVKLENFKLSRLPKYLFNPSFKHISEWFVVWNSFELIKNNNLTKFNLNTFQNRRCFMFEKWNKKDEVILFFYFFFSKQRYNGKVTKKILVSIDKKLHPLSKIQINEVCVHLYTKGFTVYSPPEGRFHNFVPKNPGP